MKKIANPKDKSLQDLRTELRKNKSEYTYEINGNALTVGKSKDIMLNIMKGDENFFVVEATPFMYRGIAVVVVLGTIILLLPPVPFIWWKVVVYIAGYFVSGISGDAIFRFIKRKEYAPFRADVIEVMERAVGK